MNLGEFQFQEKNKIYYINFLLIYIYITYFCKKNIKKSNDDNKFLLKNIY